MAPRTRFPLEQSPTGKRYSSHLIHKTAILYLVPNVLGAFMSKPLVVSIPHRLGKDEAVRRLKAGLGNVRSSYGFVFVVQEEIWTGDHLQFRVSALGQVASGTIDVAEDVVNLQVFLPWLLAKIANAIQPLVRKEGTLMLGKK